MKILLINGSPKGKRSNSLRLAEAFAEGMDAVCETITLADLDIKGCRGCFGCWKATPGKCVIRDDMGKVFDQLISADVIIYSFPLYYFSVPGILKDFIDRQLPMVLPFMTDREDGVGSGSHPARYDMSGKRYVLISTCGFWSAKGNYDAVCGMFDHMCGKGNYETLFCGQGELFSIPELTGQTDAYLDTVRRAGAEYAGGGISDSTRSELSEPLFPKEQFEAMADASWGISKENGQKTDESETFTRQMAALYRKDSFDGRVRVLEMDYTDIGKSYQIRMTAEGAEVLTDGSAQPDTRVHTPYTVWRDIAQGKISGTKALGDHLYSVDGDFSLMINWDKFFGSSTPKRKKTDGNDGLLPPDMSTLLIPWCAMWMILPIVGAKAAAAVIAITVLVPLIKRRHGMTIYDQISLAAVGILSSAVMMTGNTVVPCVAGHMIFGLMWLISCFTREPLCAAYVKYGYGGDEALENPLFMKTNYILAACWGVLYVIEACAEIFLYRSGLGLVAGILSSVLPAAMGAFTVFFEKWYPAHLAGIRSAE